MVIKGQLGRRTISALVVSALVFTALIGTQILVKAAEGTEVSKDSAVYVETTSMKDYWSANDGEAKAPVKQGYIFAGWYRSSDAKSFTALKEADIVQNGVPATGTYAKFISDDVLSVKTMVEAGIEKDSTEMTTETHTTLRFLSAVDSKNYQTVGFEYSLGGGTIKNKDMTRVWSKLKKNPAGTDVVEPKSVFGDAANYFIALDITDVYKVNFDKTVYVRPYWVTMDGTKVMGMAKNVRVEDKYTDYSYISVPVNLMTDGVSPAQLAAGKVTLTYDSVNYRVVANNKGEMVDTGRVLDELSCRVNESTGTITIVANGAQADKNVPADGLFANIRFQHKADAVKGNLEGVNLQIKRADSGVEFCNWKEEDQTTKVNVQ